MHYGACTLQLIGISLTVLCSPWKGKVFSRGEMLTRSVACTDDTFDGALLSHHNTWVGGNSWEHAAPAAVPLSYVTASAGDVQYRGSQREMTAGK